MHIEVTCDGCQARYKIDDKYAGKSIKCKKCGGKIRIPAAQGIGSTPPAFPMSDLGEFDLAALQAAAESERKAPGAPSPEVQTRVESAAQQRSAPRARAATAPAAPAARTAAPPPPAVLSRGVYQQPAGEERPSLWEQPAMQQLDSWLVRAGVVATIIAAGWPLWDDISAYFKLPDFSQFPGGAEFGRIVTKHVIYGTLLDVGLVVAVYLILVAIISVVIEKLAEGFNSPLPENALIRMFATIGVPALIMRGIFKAMASNAFHASSSTGFIDPIANLNTAKYTAATVAVFAWIGMYYLYFRFKPKFLAVALPVGTVMLVLGVWGAGQLYDRMSESIINSMQQEAFQARPHR